MAVTNGIHGDGLPHSQKRSVGTSADTASPPGNGTEEATVLTIVLENLSRSVQQALSLLEGPLGETLRARLHNQDTLPDAHLSGLAAAAVDVLHKAQLLLEPKSLILADHFLGYVNSKCLNAAVERGVADVLAKGPLGLDQLSEATEARPDRLAQVMRVLYNNGIFDYDEPSGTYTNNEASSLLRTDHWTQWRNWVELYGNQFYDVARGIPDSTKKQATRCAAQINYDTDDGMFKYFQDQGWIEILHRTLGGGAAAMAPGILEDFPWETLLGTDGGGGVVVDIGGGGGGFLATLLRRFPKLRGGVFDLPEVVAHAKGLFHDAQGKYADVGDRVAPEHLIGGDFFKSVPAFHAYTMKWCLHDWKDAEAATILSNIRKAIVKGPGSRLVILETVLGNGRSQRLSRYGDIHMMMTANGQERTEAQWRDLASRCGWEIKNIYTLRNAWVKAIEMAPDDKGYIMGHDEAEVRRLAEQHEWIKASMGSLVHCPINPRKESMRILDSGTADGRWLTDALSTLPASTKGFGVDIAPHLFPSSMPDNIQLLEHSVTDPFPPEWDASFDLVNQKLVLSACDAASARRVVGALFAMVKPGGWIQLLECDHSGGFTEAQKARSPATARFGELVVRARDATGTSGQYGLAIGGFLRDTGALDVVETVMDCPVGALAATPALRESTTENLLAVVRSLKSARNDIPNLNLDADFFDKLHEELATELSTQGSTQRFHLVYGRRPRAT